MICSDISQVYLSSKWLYRLEERTGTGEKQGKERKGRDQ